MRSIAGENACPEEVINTIDDSIIAILSDFDTSTDSSSDQSNNENKKRNANKRERATYDKERRLKKKKEMHELCAKAARLKEEQKSFIAQIEELQAQAEFYVLGDTESDDLDPLQIENKQLKEEIEIQRNLVKRLKQSILATHSELDLTNHLEKMDKLRMKRKCTELCHEAVRHSMGIVKDFCLEKEKGFVDSTRWVLKNFAGGNDRTKFYRRLIPNNVPYENASRSITVDETIVDVDLDTYEKAILLNNNSGPRHPDLKVYRTLYADENCDIRVSTADPLLEVFYMEYESEGVQINRVQGRLRKRAAIPQSVFEPNVDTAEEKAVHCIVDVLTNVSSAFNKTIPSNKEIYISFRVCVPVNENQTKVIFMESLAINEKTLYMLRENEEGDMIGKALQHNLDLPEARDKKLADFLANMKLT